MRGIGRLLRWFLAVALVIPFALFVVLLLALHTPQGRQLAERAITRITDGEIVVFGVSGRFPGVIQFTRIELRDPRGTWAVAKNLRLEWSPNRLLDGLASVDVLEADALDIVRLPEYPEDDEEISLDLPLPLVIERIQANHLGLAADVIGQPAALTLVGSGRLRSLGHAVGELVLQRADRLGIYRIRAQTEGSAIHLDLHIEEPERGLLATSVGLSELGAITLNGALNGSKTASQVKFGLHAGHLSLTAEGQVDLSAESVDLRLDASAPAMRLSPDLSWGSAALTGAVSGPVTAVSATGNFRMEQLAAAGMSAQRITAELAGDATGPVRLKGRLESLRIPGPQPGLLQSHPLRFEADAQLDKPDRPVMVAVDHPLIQANSRFTTAGVSGGELHLAIPDLKPIANLAGLDLRGAMKGWLQLREKGDNLEGDAEATLAITGGQAPIPVLLGSDTRVAASVALGRKETTLKRFQLTGKILEVSADGRYSPEAMQLGWKASLSNMSVLARPLSGNLTAQGQLIGPLEDLSFSADVAGEISPQGLRGGPVRAQITAKGIPHSMSGAIAAQADVLGSRLQANIRGDRSDKGDLHIGIDRGIWNSASISGAVTLTSGGTWPIGTLQMRVGRMEDLGPLVGQSLTGVADLRLEMTRVGGTSQANLRLQAEQAGLPGAIAADTIHATVTATDSGTGPKLEGKLIVSNYSAGRATGSAELQLLGTPRALDLKLSGTAGFDHHEPVRLSGVALLEPERPVLLLSAFRGTWRGETLRLISPAEVTLGPEIAIDRLHLGIRKSELWASGKLSPAWDIEARIRNFPAQLATVLYPKADLGGDLNAAVRLSGPHAQPRGSVELTLANLRLLNDLGRGLPPLQLQVTANLDGETGQINARASAGPLLALTVQGHVVADTLDLRAGGSTDIKLLDPIITPGGRRARGLLALDTRIGGTVTDPRLLGQLQLTNGSFEDYSLGTHLTAASGSVRFEGNDIQLTRFDARMNPGRISASGHLGWQQPGLPLDIRLVARNARPLAGERLNVMLNSDIVMRGMASEKLTVSGTIDLQRAEIRIPERMPARIAILDVRRPGEAPPPPSPPGPDFGLDLTIAAPGEIFVRGRGLDAELGGKVRLKGSTSKLEPSGRFAMRRGEYKIAGRVLTFRKGEVGFDGGTLTDPALDFVAGTASPTVTATLSVTGTAGKPKINLSSVPELPQDEILSHLLFSRDTATLGPLELAQIAAALASLTGVTSGISNPLENVREGLGLDRLSMGSSAAGPTLEGGRYVAPGVYLGAKQALTGSTPQAAVQIDVTEGLKVEGTVGSGSPGSSSQTGSNSVGVIYQYEY